MSENTPFAVPKPPVYKTVKLKSGKTVEYRAAIGADLIKAHTMVPEGAPPTASLYAVVAVVSKLDGQDLTYEGMLELPLMDFLELENLVLGENFTLPPPPVSPASSNSDSVLAN